jgi:hypothetical protein
MVHAVLVEQVVLEVLVELEHRTDLLVLLGLLVR